MTGGRWAAGRVVSVDSDSSFINHQKTPLGGVRVILFVKNLCAHHTTPFDRSKVNKGHKVTPRLSFHIRNTIITA